MNYKTIKLASEAPIALELIKRDNGVYGVVIGDLRIESDYGLRVLIAQPYEEVSKHRVTATIEGFGAKVTHYATRYEADSDVRKLEDAGATVVREDVKVLIDDSGKVLKGTLGSETSIVGVADTFEDVPF